MDNTEPRALILLAHGAHDPAWAGPVLRVQATLAATRPGLAVETAFLEFMAPTLEEAAATLIKHGAKRITVVPVFLAQGGHIKRELPERMEALQRFHPDCEWALAPTAGEAPEVVAAIAAHAAAQADL
jgi:sirohydrochlorin cobaltochelatase